MKSGAREAKENDLLIPRLLQPDSPLPSLPEIRVARLEPPVGALIALQPLMAIAVHGVGAIDHFLAQEIQLADANPAMMPTPAREPASSPQKPRAEREDGHDGQSDGGVIQRLGSDGVFRRQAEDHGDERDPEASHDGEGFRRAAEAEGSAFEVAFVDEAHGDGDTVGKVEADGGDGCRAVECDGGSEGREGEEEGTAGAEEDGADWRVEATVDDVKSVRNAAVTGKGKHHAGVGSLKGVSAAD